MTATYEQMRLTCGVRCVDTSKTNLQMLHCIFVR